MLLLAKYSTQWLKLYAGYERITYMAPSDRQTGFTDIGGNFLCEGCVVFNNTDIINTAFGRDGFEAGGNLQKQRIVVQTEADAQLPRIMGNRTQLQQVADWTGRDHCVLQRMNPYRRFAG